MVGTRHGVIAAVVLCAGCAGAPAETAEQASARRAMSCTAEGFTPDSDAYRLCLMIERQNDRLGMIENRLRFVEGMSAGPMGPYWGPPWW